MTTLTIEWDKISISGFESMEIAERFVSKICMKVAPDKEYKIYSYQTIK